RARTRRGAVRCAEGGAPHARGDGAVRTHVGQFHVVDEPEELARVAAALIVDAALARPRVGLFLAGGATPRRAYEIVAAIASASDFAGVHGWLGDEPAVPIHPSPPHP